MSNDEEQNKNVYLYVHLYVLFCNDKICVLFSPSLPFVPVHKSSRTRAYGLKDLFVQPPYSRRMAVMK